MARYRDGLRPHGPWEMSTANPWGGVYFGESARYTRYIRPLGNSTAYMGVNRGTPRYGESQNVPRFDPNNILEVKYPRMYGGAAPVMALPEVLGCYSVDSEQNFGHDKKLLRFLDRHYLPERGRMKVRLDLNEGSDGFCQYCGNAKERFNHVLRWILENKALLVTTTSSSSKRLSVDFISELVNFCRVMRTPYNMSEAWTLLAVEYNGTIYMRNCHKRKQQTVNGASTGPDMDEIAKWGHTFKHYMRGGDEEEEVDPNKEYHCVLKAKIGDNSLLYAPNMDCADPDKFKENFDTLEAFLSVKCCKEIQGAQKMNIHKKFKLNQWWAENKLLGIPRMLVGYRNDSGIVNSIEMLKTAELPEKASGDWNPDACLNFLEAFLAFVKERVQSNPGMTLVFEYESRGDIKCKKLGGQSITHFLPQWYIDQLFSAEKSVKSSKS